MAPIRREPAEVAAQRGRLAGHAARRVPARGQMGEVAAEQDAVDRDRLLHSSSPRPRHEPVEIRPVGGDRVGRQVGQRPGELGEAPRHPAERTDRSSPTPGTDRLEPSARAREPSAALEAAEGDRDLWRAADPSAGRAPPTSVASRAEAAPAASGPTARAAARRSRRPRRAGRCFEAQRHEHVERVDRRRGAVDEEQVGPLGRRAAHGAGDGHDRHTRCCASVTVSSEPPRTLDSTTTTTSASVARMRLRAGKRWAAGRVSRADPRCRGGPARRPLPRDRGCSAGRRRRARCRRRRPAAARPRRRARRDARPRRCPWPDRRRW